jgi:hypothetical protein
VCAAVSIESRCRAASAIHCSPSCTRLTQQVLCCSPEPPHGCKNPVACLVAPCELNNPCQVGETCVNDYCGGCFARCRLADGKASKLCH